MTATDAALVAFARAVYSCARDYDPRESAVPTDTELLALCPEEARRVLLDERAAGVLMMLTRVRELDARPLMLIVGDEQVTCVSREYLLTVEAGSRAEGRREAFKEVAAYLQKRGRRKSEYEVRALAARDEVAVAGSPIGPPPAGTPEAYEHRDAWRHDAVEEQP